MLICLKLGCMRVELLPQLMNLSREGIFDSTLTPKIMAVDT